MHEAAKGLPGVEKSIIAFNFETNTGLINAR
jgi:hypothetical protein